MWRRSSLRRAAVRWRVIRRPECGRDAVGYAQFYSLSHHGVIRVYDEAGNVICV